MATVPSHDIPGRETANSKCPQVTTAHGHTESRYQTDLKSRVCSSWYPFIPRGLRSSSMCWRNADKWRPLTHFCGVHCLFLKQASLHAHKHCGKVCLPTAESWKWALPAHMHLKCYFLVFRMCLSFVVLYLGLLHINVMHWLALGGHGRVQLENGKLSWGSRGVHMWQGWFTVFCVAISNW